MIILTYLSKAVQQTLISMLCALLIGIGLIFSLFSTTQAQSEENTSLFRIAPPYVGNYPSIVVTITNVLSPEIGIALENGKFKICETLNGSLDECQQGIAATPLDKPQPYSLLIVLDKSLPGPDLESWSAITNSVANLIGAAGPDDAVSILPFSSETEQQSEWTSDITKTIDFLSQTTPDNTWTKLNHSLNTALISAMQRPEGSRRIVVIADRLDNTLHDPLLMAKQLFQILKNAGDVNVPIDLICYGPVVTNPFLDQLSYWVARTGGRFVTVATAKGVDGELRPVYQYLNAYSHNYAFNYITGLPSDEQDHNLILKFEELGVKGSEKFHLMLRKIEPISLSFKSTSGSGNLIPITDTVELYWYDPEKYLSSVTDLRLSVTVPSAHEFVEPALYYAVNVSQPVSETGPYPLTMEIPIHLSIPINQSLSNPKNQTVFDVRITVKDKYGNSGHREAQIIVHPPPAFDIVPPDSFIVSEDVATTITLISRNVFNDASSFDVTYEEILGDKVSIQTAQINQAIPITHYMVISKTSFFNDLTKTLGVTWNTLKETAARVKKHNRDITVTVTSKDLPEISRVYRFQVKPLPFPELWRNFASNWVLPYLLWLLFILLLIFVLLLLDRLARMSVMEIPITIYNRGFATIPCYLQAQEIPRPVNAKHILRRIESLFQPLWQRTKTWYTEEASTHPQVLPDNQEMEAINLHNVRLSLLVDQKKLAPAKLLQPRPTALVANNPNSIDIGQRLAKNLHVSQRAATSLRLWRQTLLRGLGIFWVANWFGTKMPRISAIGTYFSRNFSDPPTDPHKISFTLPQTDWVKLDAVALEDAAKVRLRLESTSWNPRKVVRIVVRSTPNGLDDICEYKLEVGLGGFWLNRPCKVITLDSYES